MTSGTETTTDHGQIKAWVDRHGGTPATVRGSTAEDPGALRIDFPGGSAADELDHVTWHQWFRTFEENELALVHEAAGTTHQLVPR